MTERTERAISVPEAARRIGVHPMTLRRWISQGIIPAHRVGPKLLRLREADVDAMAVGEAVVPS